jgi:3-dehydro-L-gulonate 2-dehydrogenase
MSGLVRVPEATVRETLARVLAALGFSPPRAELCARLFTETSMDGVVSHGLARFPRFLGLIRRGRVRPEVEPTRVAAFGAWEQWDGQLGPGNLNAWQATERAMVLARTQGIGAVTLRHTNHWMRAGTYGWQAAEAGFALVAWTNTEPNMPPWGGRRKVLGNNPLVMAVPRTGAPVVLDFAVSQFSYGRMERAARRGEPLPLPGGYDEAGELTTDPAAVLRSGRPLPIGYWKGAGLALALDLLAATLSGGRTTRELGQQEEEYGVSQVFLAFDVAKGQPREALDRVVGDALEALHRGEPAAPGTPVRYPGERVLETRAESRRLGVPVDAEVWEEIQRL